MLTQNERKILFRRHHYRWKQIKGNWLLIGPDGWRVNPEEAERIIEQSKEQLQLTPQQWAQAMIDQHPLILDTETTGLDPANNEIIDLALVELDGTVVLNTLIQCQGSIPSDATAIHGITKEMLQDQPTFPDAWQMLLPFLSRPLVIYNASYDIPMLAYGAHRYHIRMSHPAAHCLMIHYTQYHPGSNGAYQRLETACQRFRIDVGIHRALSDAQATRQVLLNLTTAP